MLFIMGMAVLLRLLVMNLSACRLYRLKGTVKQPILNISGFAPLGEDSDWPGHSLFGNYSVPTGVTGIQIRLLVTPAAKGWVATF